MKRIDVFFLLGFMVTVTPTPGYAVSSQVALVGTDFQGNFYEIDAMTGNSSLIGVTGIQMIGLAYDESSQVLYGSSKSTLYKIDPFTGAAISVGLFGHELMHSIEFDSTTGTLYGITLNDTPVSLWEINISTGQASSVGAIEDSYSGMAFDPATATMYASNIASSGLVTVDLSTGDTTFIGNFNAGIQVGTALAYDPSFSLVAADNRSSRNGPSDLYQIDENTGQATLIGNSINGNLLGLAFIPKSLLIPEPTTCVLGLTAFCLAIGRRQR